MKFKILKLEYEFDRDDAKIVVPIILLMATLIFSQINPAYPIGISIFYYLVYFFGITTWRTLQAMWPKKCPACKSKHIILQGYQEYKSDEYYAYYLCLMCNQTSIEANNRLIKI